jgi:hypothetical protein
MKIMWQFVTLACIGEALWWFVPDGPQYFAFMTAGFIAGLVGIKPWAGLALMAIPFGVWAWFAATATLRATTIAILVDMVFIAGISVLAVCLGMLIRKRRWINLPGFSS